MKTTIQSTVRLVQRVGAAAICIMLLAGGMSCAQATNAQTTPQSSKTAKAKRTKKAAMPENFHAPEVKIALAKPAGKDLVVELTMINHGPGNFRVLKWNLPDDEELTNNIFTITRDGKEVAYRGKMAKRRVTAESYRTLVPARTYSERINLSQAYDVAAAGHYQIQYQVTNQSAPDVSNTVLTDIKSNQLEVDR
jgi:hypothetical protein